MLIYTADHLLYIVSMETVVTNIRIDEQFCDHELTGNYAGHRECHVLSNLLLIYRIYKNILILALVNTGTHSDLLKNNQQCL